MYLHNKDGFFEIDKWDGSPIQGVALPVGAPYMVVRARHQEDIERFIDSLFFADGSHVFNGDFYHTPQWDYPYRAYVLADDLVTYLTQAVADVDYRNFKHWCSENDREQYGLAHRIWEASFKDAAIPGERGE